MPPQRDVAGPRRTPGRWFVIGILVLSAIGILALALNAPWPQKGAGSPPSGAGEEGPAGPSRSPRLGGAGAPADRQGASPADVAEDATLLDDLASASGADLVRVATDLRRSLRLDAAALRAALDRLLDPELDPETRARLVFVLGTLESDAVDAAILLSLQRFSGDDAYLRAALLALGAQREPQDEDDIFDLGDRPFGVVGPGGLGITVRRAIDDAVVRSALLDHLDGSPEVRYAAARALDASVASPDVRAGLRMAIVREDADAVAARLAEPLGRWAATARDGPEREAVLGELLDRALAPELDETRMRLEKELGRTALGEAGWSRLLGATGPGEALAIRQFAIVVLGTAADRADGGTVEQIRERLGDLVASDGDAGIRDLAARQVARLPRAEATLAVLEQAASDDAAWNVRYSALQGLAALGDSEALRRALERAHEDGEPRVVDLATEIQARLPVR